MPTEPLITPECREFLLEGTRTAKIATVRRDGRPHVVPVWFLLDGDQIIFTSWHEAVKSGNMQRDERVAICVDDEDPPFSFALIEGIATIDEQAEDLQYWASRLGGRYMGEDQAQAYGRRNAVQGEWLVRVRPTKVVFQRDIAK